MSLHADVVFSEGRLGGEETSKVRFKLAVKRAELIVILPETEPISVDKKTVSRDTPKFSGTKINKYSFDSQTDASASAKIVAGAKGVNARAQAGVGAKVSLASLQSLETFEEVSNFEIKQTRTAEGHYRWQLLPSGNSQLLDGRPWNATKEPRMKVIDKRLDRTKGIAPSVRIEVRCLREDLLISNIEVKDKNVWQSFSTMSNRNKEAAAEACIRDRLCSEDLEFGNLSDPYSSIVIARITSESD